MRNFDYGSDESKKGGERDASVSGERDASVSLSSPERSRIRKSVEGISMLASIEASKASKTRRGTSYGSPASSPEKTTRRGTSYGSPSPEKATRHGSTLSPRVAKNCEEDKAGNFIWDYILASHKLNHHKLNPHKLNPHKLKHHHGKFLNLHKVNPHKLNHHDGKFSNPHKLNHHRQQRGEDGSFRSILNMLLLCVVYDGVSV
ncbi:hypothetical protein HID58_047687 [Brassica napus]|uniref:Uncharacterized protein n=1 Tax=Brassica napus TaxID=3708 RepID=A0ABQ8AZZ6_BRANA|nr:hypothetical protein HID58_047687 [Brassica napus]